MSILVSLAACAGRWRGESRLEDPGYKVSERCDSAAEVVSLLDGRFVRIDYRWEFRGKPQQGSLLVGHDPDAGLATAHWIDSWHMGRKVMALQGRSADEERIAVRGAYAAPPGPDWGWRIELVPRPGAALEVRMHNVSPEGAEELAVECVYRPA